jgi:ribokinase
MGDGGNVAPEIVVVGSINLDLSVNVERFPEPGETVLGGSVLHGGGGKGANQAVSAARLGRRVLMVGRVGDDAGGASLVAALQHEGIDVSAVEVSDGVASGLAIIEVDPSGENRIVVAPGANGAVGTEDLAAVSGAIRDAPVVLAQMEVPVPVVEALAAMPRTGRLVVNPAPATAGYNPAGVDILVPNQGELAGLLSATGVAAEAAANRDEVVDQVRALAAAASGLEAVVVTLGGDGALVMDGLRGGDPNPVHVPAHEVSVVDTTAAGDSFCAGLADALCLGADVVEAARWAARVAAVTVTRRGAQASLPKRSDVLA